MYRFDKHLPHAPNLLQFIFSSDRTAPSSSAADQAEPRPPTALAKTPPAADSTAHRPAS